MGPVLRVSNRCMPVCNSPTGRTSFKAVSPLEMAALASISRREEMLSGSLGGGTGAIRSEAGTETFRSSRKILPEFRSSSLTTSE